MCLLCNFQTPNDVEIKTLYCLSFCGDKSNYFFKELFSHDTESEYSKECYECKIKFTSCRQKKIIAFWCIVHSLEEQILPYLLLL